MIIFVIPPPMWA